MPSSNIFLQTDRLIANAVLYASEQIMAPSLISGSVENEITNEKVGQTVRVKVPPIFTASGHDGTGSYAATNVTETDVDVPIVEEAFIKIPLSGRQLQFDITDFETFVLFPAVLAVAERVNQVLIQQLAMGFAPNMSGTGGGNPSTFDDLVDAHQALFDQKCPLMGKNAIITSTTMGNLLKLSQFQNLDFGGNRAMGVSAGTLEPTHNTAYWPTQAATSIDIGDTAGTVLTDGVPTEGAAIIHLDGFTEAAGTVKRGARFTVAGDTQIYTVTADLTLATNEGDIPVTPTVTAATAAAGDDAAVTFETAATHNMIFHQASAVKAIIAPESLPGLVSQSASHAGIGMNITFESTIDGTDGREVNMLIGSYVAVEVIRAFGGTLVGS